MDIKKRAPIPETTPVIQENFKNYIPPKHTRSVVESLLLEVPAKYLTGLGIVVLTNSDNGNRKKRRQKTLSRGRKVAVKDCRGLYLQQWQGRDARIELFIDNIVGYLPHWLLTVPFLRNLIFGQVLFHEIGHHIHYTCAPEYREREDVANSWGKKLGRSYIRRKYWYLIPLLFLISFATKPLRRNKDVQ